MDKVKKLASSFIKEHWDEIDKQKCDITESKSTILKMIAKDLNFATWIITECMRWGCAKDGFEPNYLEKYRVDCDSDFNVYKIDESYFKYDHDTQTLIEVEAKYKTVVYFD